MYNWSPLCYIDYPEIEQPDVISIPQDMWFVIATLSVVGYGDVILHASIGKFLACFQIVVELCDIATPLAIVGHSFFDIWSDRFHSSLFDKFAHGAIQLENSMTVPYSTLSCLRSHDFLEHLRAGEIIDELVPTAACSGNLLLNVGPTDGLILLIFKQNIFKG